MRALISVKPPDLGIGRRRQIGARGLREQP